ncbi:MAG TPA: ABC transporter ATP-binding protein, partial [Verrucomicrobiae bacterium]|nr:ABC transporter ATP-binding protein [Verrucomicrobiae bacterium]
PAALVGDLEGRIWRKSVPQAEVASYGEKFKVISMRRFSGQTLIHVYSNQEPDPSFELVTPDLEDVYFATIKGFMNPAAPAAKVN